MFKSLQALRVRLIKLFIDINEKLIFEKKLEAFYKKAFPRKISLVIDVGANKGQSIDFFLKLNPYCEVHAFEANKTLADKLEKKYKHKPNVIINKVGVSDVNGEKTFNQNVLDYTSTFEEVNNESHYLKEKAKILGVDVDNLTTARYKIQTIALAEYIASLNPVRHIDVIKVDVEGHEYSVLQGLFSTPHPSAVKFIQLENHTDDMYINRVSFDDIKWLLKEKKYKLCATIKHGFGGLEEVIFGSDTPAVK